MEDKMFSKVNELSLLIYLTVVNHVSLSKVMAKWNGYTDEEYYNNEITQIDLYEGALCDIDRVYHIPMSKYFESKRTQTMFKLFDKNYKYSEITALTAPLYWITKDMWSDEDRERLKELRKEYIDKVEDSKDLL